jgi:hypothetical protein
MLTLTRIVPALLLGAALVALAPATHSADQTPPARAVTARPPLEAVPVSPMPKNLQLKMRQCNTAADGKKLAGAPRETYIKNCMAPPRKPETPARSTASR